MHTTHPIVQCPCKASYLHSNLGDACRRCRPAAPVGPGTVLDAAMQSGVIPIVDLREVFRQAQESAIVMSAHQVLNGVVPTMPLDRFHQQPQVSTLSVLPMQ